MAAGDGRGRISASSGDSFLVAEQLGPDNLVLVIGVEMSVLNAATFISQLRAESQD
jgi:hypothetical protein